MDIWYPIFMQEGAVLSLDGPTFITSMRVFETPFSLQRAATTIKDRSPLKFRRAVRLMVRSINGLEDRQYCKPLILPGNQRLSQLFDSHQDLNFGY